MKCLVVDDEPKAREVLISLLDEYCPNIEVLGQASSVEQAVNFVKLQSVDLVFLDIEMPGGSGFDFLNQLDHIDFEVIFTTAYDQYAIKAIKFSAVDYLLKPVDPNELTKAVSKAEERVTQAQAMSYNEFQALLENIKPKNKRKIAIAEGKGMVILSIDQIIRCEADKNYTNIYLKNGEHILSSKNLKEYEEMLKEEAFFRVHQSHLINLNYVEKITKEDGAYLILKDGSQVEVSRRRKSELMNRLISL